MNDSGHSCKRIMTMKSLKDKTLFITGASRGIGKAIALRAEGVSDFKQYQINPSLNESQLMPDLFL